MDIETLTRSIQYRPPRSLHFVARFHTHEPAFSAFSPKRLPWVPETRSVAIAPDGIAARSCLRWRQDPRSARQASSLDQGARGISHEAAVLADARVQLAQPVPVPLDREVRHPPDALAQDVDDRADVEELHPAAGGPKIHDLEAGVTGEHGLTLGIPRVVLPWQRSDEELDELRRGVGPNVLALWTRTSRGPTSAWAAPASG